MDISKFEHLAKASYSPLKKFLHGLKRQRPDRLDENFHQIHDDVFTEIDCLACANCCKTTSPIFINVDIERIAKSLKMKPSVFTETYLKIDDEGDYVLQKSPCAFLGTDNYCSIYDVRPRACREYPHTNRKKMYQILDLTLQNTQVCPAVLKIVQKLEVTLGDKI